MRVVAGIRRGKKLAGFDGDSIRPTSDRVKENIFNIICAYIPGATVLDLFSGSGALAVEALSRGAKHATLVDSAAASIEVMRKNTADTDFVDYCDIIRSDALEFLRQNRQQFDVIFLDPPYNTGLLAAALELIAKHDTLFDDGIVVVERDDVQDLALPDGLTIQKDRRYGRTVVTVVCRSIDGK